MHEGRMDNGYCSQFLSQSRPAETSGNDHELHNNPLNRQYLTQEGSHLERTRY